MDSHKNRKASPRGRVDIYSTFAYSVRPYWWWGGGRSHLLIHHQCAQTPSHSTRLTTRPIWDKTKKIHEIRNEGPLARNGLFTRRILMVNIHFRQATETVFLHKIQFGMPSDSISYHLFENTN